MTMAMVKKISEIVQEEVREDFVKGTKIQWLVTKKDGAPTFAMRRFVVAPGGEINLHQHPWEHEVYIISGKGVVLGEKEDIPVEKDSFAYVPPNEKHGFKNTSKTENFVFLCMIPHPK